MASLPQRWRALILACAELSIGSNAYAQVSDVDRLARCENNRDALARAQIDLTMTGYESDEQIARMRAGLISLRRDGNELDVFYLHAVSYPAGDEKGHVRILDALRKVMERMQQTYRTLGTGCGLQSQNMESYYFCLRSAHVSIETRIDQGLRANRVARPVLVRIATAQRNLAALNCDQPRAPGVTGISGNWRGLDGTTYAIAVAGNAFTWTRSGTDETANGTISGDSMSAQWRSSQGSGGGGASIVRGSGGTPVEIRWSNGNVFTR